MLDYAKEYVQKLLKGEYYFLTYSGPTEIGKTHLLEKLTSLIRKLDIQYPHRPMNYPLVVFEPFNVMVQKLLDPKLNHLDTITKAGVVIIEEFLSQDFKNPNAFNSILLEKAQEVLNARKRKPTVLDTNKIKGEVVTLDVRVASRLQRDGGIFLNINTKTIPYLSRKHASP